MVPSVHKPRWDLLGTQVGHPSDLLHFMHLVVLALGVELQQDFLRLLGNEPGAGSSVLKALWLGPGVLLWFYFFYCLHFRLFRIAVLVESQGLRRNHFDVCRRTWLLDLGLGHVRNRVLFFDWGVAQLSESQVGQWFAIAGTAVYLRVSLSFFTSYKSSFSVNISLVSSLEIQLGANELLRPHPEGGHLI